MYDNWYKYLDLYFQHDIKYNYGLIILYILNVFTKQHIALSYFNCHIVSLIRLNVSTYTLKVLTN